MEMEEIQTQGCSKFARISNGNGKMQNLDEEDGGGGGGGAGGGGGGGLNISSLCAWPSSSRIVRVSRASGGKDRHSKVLTSKGLRDRRVRLSVNTAIQFYDLQDRLGYDQPSKAVEWLLKAAAPSIAELPSLNPPFAADDSEERRSSAGIGIEQQQPTAGGEIELEADQNFQQQRSLSLSKSCSSTSETSKGSGGLSLSRSESRIKARERARERAAKDKEKENDGGASHHHHHNLNPISSSFTELLTGTTTTTSPSPNSSVVHQQTSRENANFFAKSPRQWDYFTSGGLLHQSATSAAYSGNMNLTNPLHHHQHFSELQQFSFVSDHLAPVVVTADPGNNGNNNNNNNNHNLNFSISPSSGFINRGTLQSNSSSSSSSSSPSSLLPHFQRFDGSSSSPSFFTISAATHNANVSAPSVENHHNFLPGFDARLQLYYGDPNAASHRHSHHKGKDKS